MIHPMYVASEIAEWMRSDPIAAAQIRESIPETELADILGIRVGLNSVDFDDLSNHERSVILDQLSEVFTAKELRAAAARA